MKVIAAAAAAAVALYASASFAGMEEATKWVNDEFQPSTLSMRWSHFVGQFGSQVKVYSAV